MNLSFPQLFFATVGAVLLYSAITGKMPADVIKGQLGQNNTPDPVKTGKASPNESSGHNYDLVGTQMVDVPISSRRARQMYPVVN